MGTRRLTYNVPLPTCPASWDELNERPGMKQSDGAWDADAGLLHVDYLGGMEPGASLQEAYCPA